MPWTYGIWKLALYNLILVDKGQLDTPGAYNPPHWKHIIYAYAYTNLSLKLAYGRINLSFLIIIIKK